MKYKFKYLLIIFIVFFMLPINALASVIYVHENGYVSLREFGLTAKRTSHYRTSYKTTSDGDVAFCIAFTDNFGGSKYTSCDKVLSDFQLIHAGQIIKYVNMQQDFDWKKKYAYKVAALNTAFYRKVPGSAEVTGGSPSIKTIVDEARRRAEEIDAASDANFAKDLGHTLSNATMKKLKANKQFISEKVTFKGLKKTYLGSTPTYSFSVSGLKSGQNAYLCTGSTGTGCTAVDGVTLSGVETKAYYVKVTGVDASASALNFSVKLSGSVRISYPKGQVFCRTSAQKVLIYKTKNESFSAKHVVNFKVNKTPTPTPTPTPGPTPTPTPTPAPVTHEIEILKTDENGEALSGAEFTYEGPLELTRTTSSDGTRITYTYGPVPANADQFYGKNFCFTETTAPDGYSLGKTTVDNKSCYTISKNTADSVKCYYNGASAAGTEVGMDYCNTNIQYACKKTTTDYMDQVVEVPPIEEGGEPTTVTNRVLDPTTARITYSGYDESCVASDDETTSKVEVEKLCGILGSNNNFSSMAPSDNPDDWDAYCRDPDDYEKVEIDDGSIFVVRSNKKTNLKISKKLITGDEEIEGAKLKICTEATYNSNKESCEAAKTIEDVKLSWTSGKSEKEFSGIKAGTYYLIETVPPAGYKLVTTATKFTMDKYGEVKTGNTTVTDNHLVINNQLNNLTISKTDIATSKELPGATISICEVVKVYEEAPEEEGLEPGDEKDTEHGTAPTTEDDSVVEVDGTKVQLDLDMDGECIPAKLADGTDATWTSTDKPKVISGLPAGTYYLVEKTAPRGYSTAEAILFKMTDTGELTDKDGKSLANNKLVMKDEHLEEVKTGMLPIIIISILAFVSLGILDYVNSPKYRKRVIKN